jgi:predicted regulator of Ras-like GTPase activity (Roadblock/LC7/MglB family)
MRDLTTVGRIPHVASAVLGDLAGAFHDAVREGEGESVAAVAGFVASALARVGDDLGLGALRSVVVASEARAGVLALAAGAVVAVTVDAPAALPAVEKALDDSIRTGA